MVRELAPGQFFGVILGTGCGGGVVIDGKLVNGPMGIAGEWGHNPLPWPQKDEWPGPTCWCGRHGCMETWVSGPALEASYLLVSETEAKSEQIGHLAANGDETAKHVFARHCDRLGRGLAHVINIFDPEVVVLGGGLSNLDHLYQLLPAAISPHVFLRATANLYQTAEMGRFQWCAWRSTTLG